MVDKLERDGNVAVIYSPGYGSGWSTTNDGYGYGLEELVFSKELAEFIDQNPGKCKEIQAKAKDLFPKAYHGGADELEIEWLPKGTEFMVHEYDGYESVWTAKDMAIYTA